LGEWHSIRVSTIDGLPHETHETGMSIPTIPLNNIREHLDETERTPLVFSFISHLDSGSPS